MLAVTLALIGFFAFMIVRATQPAMGVLYGDLPFSEAAAIIKELDTRGVKYETRQDGQTIRPWWTASWTAAMLVQRR